MAALAHHVRQLRRSAQYQAHWELAWQLAHTPGKAKYGVLKAWQEALAQLGWEWPSPFLLHDPQTNEPRHLLTDPPAKLQHDGRESLGSQALRDLAKRRASFRGLEAGADRVASTALFRHIEDPYLDGFLRNLLAGGVLWGALRHTMGAVDHPDCAWCRSAPDTSEHLLAHCPATAPLRTWANITTAELLLLPPYVLHHGIFPKGWGGDACTLTPPGKWRHPKNFATLQLFQLTLHVCRAVAQLQPSINLCQELPSELRSEIELTALNAGIRLPMLPSLAECRTPPGCTHGATQPTGATS